MVWGKEKGLLCWDLTIPCKKTKHVLCGQIYKKEVVTVQEKFSEQNAIVDATQVAQIQRLVNTVHYTVQSNTPNTQFENLCVLQLVNGVDLGYQYYSDKAFAEFLNLLDLEITCHVVMLIQASQFLSLEGDSTPDTHKISQEGGMARIMDMETMLPTELCLGYDALGSEKADGHDSAIITLAEKYGCMH